MRLFFTSFGIVIFILASWFTADVLLFQKERDTKREWLKRISQQECILKELVQIENRGDYQKKYEAILNAEWGALEKKVPVNADPSHVLALLDRVAAEKKVVLHDFQVGKPLFQDPWYKLPVTINVTASFPVLANFLKGIAEQERYIMLQGLKVGPGQVEVNLLVYFRDWEREPLRQLSDHYQCGDYTIPEKLNLVLAIPKTQSLIQKLGRNPFILPEVNVHLTGVIFEGDEWIALLEDEKGIGHVARVGDELSGGFEVKKIFKDSVILMSGAETKRLTWSN